MASTPAEILWLGADSVVEIGVGPNRTNRANATRIQIDDDLTTHTFTNPRPWAEDTGPNHGAFRRPNRREDATYNVTPLKTDDNVQFMNSLRNGTPVCIWINPRGKGFWPSLHRLRGSMGPEFGDGGWCSASATI